MPIANRNAPLGFSLYQRGGQSEPKRIERPVVGGRATNLMAGDAYSLDANGDAFRALGTDATPGVVRGIVEGFRFQAITADPQGPVSQQYLGLNDTGWLIGIEDAEAEFQVLVNANGALTTNIGQDVDLTNVDGDSVLLRQSRQQIDGSSFGSGGSGQFLMVDLVQSPADNAFGAFARIVVKILNKVI